MEERQDGHPDGVEHFHPDAPVGSGGLVEFLDAGGQLGVALGQPTLGVAVAWLSFRANAIVRHRRHR
jgi:hypothetical protein